MKSKQISWEEIEGLLNHDQFATAFCKQVVCIAETWDDLYDKDKEVNKNTINDVFWMALVALPSNPFYRKYFGQLNPLITNGIMAWLDANECELCGDEGKEIAHDLRNHFLDVLNYTLYLVRGYDFARDHGYELRWFESDTKEDFVKEGE